jgi:hypothetical protein
MQQTNHGLIHGDDDDDCLLEDSGKVNERICMASLSHINSSSVSHDWGSYGICGSVIIWRRGYVGGMSYKKKKGENGFSNSNGCPSGESVR